MLKVNVSNGEQIVHFEGSSHDLLVELAYTIGVLHGRVKAANPTLAGEFSVALVESLVDPDAPVWDYTPGAGGFSACIPVKKKD